MLTRHGVVKVPFAGWFLLDPKSMTRTKIEKTDPRVVDAESLGVDYLPGNENASETTASQNAMLLRELGRVRDELDETKQALHAASVAANVEHIDSLTGTNAETERLNARVTELETEIGRLTSRLTMADGEVLILRSRLASAASAPTSATDDELRELQQKYASLEQQLFDAAYASANDEQSQQEELATS